MRQKWRKSEEVIKEFEKKNSNRLVKTLEPKIMNIDPQRIIAINSNYKYPDILDDFSMKGLKKSVNKKGWTNERPQGFYLLMFPNGDLVVGGCGNHRAVLSKELSIPTVKALVAQIIYCD